MKQGDSYLGIIMLVSLLLYMIKVFLNKKLKTNSQMCIIKTKTLFMLQGPHVQYPNNFSLLKYKKSLAQYPCVEGKQTRYTVQ